MSKKIKKVDVDIIPLVLSAILILVSLIVVSQSNYVLNLKHYIGFVCFVVSLFLYFKNKTTYYIVFGLTNVAGVFGLIDFYFRTYKVGFSSFGVNPVFVFLLVLFFAMAYQIAEKLDSNK